ncbi:MAG: helix-turn-helix domain-containing protein [Thermodesulfobacteriota bacterium]
MEEQQGPGFGAALREARQRAGLSLEGLAAASRIPERYLAALEAEQWDALPGGLTGRGFARLAAKELGLPAEELLEAYRRARGGEKPETRLTPIEPDWQVDFRKERSLGPVFLTLLLLLGAALGVWVWSPWSVEPRGGPPAPVADVPPLPAPVPEASLEPVAPAPALPTVAPEPEPLPPAAPPPAPALHRLEILAAETVWVRVVADGGPPEERTLRQGQSLAVEARQEVSVRLGNAGGVHLTWNGETLKAPGPRGSVLTLVLPQALESLRP